MHHAPAFNVVAVDTTGAGDVFRAGFIYALLRNMPIEQTLRFANAAAALSCTRPGAISSVPTLAEVNALVTGTGLGP
jgi:sugar/nucleoside kinase (ribokinase family)